MPTTRNGVTRHYDDEGEVIGLSFLDEPTVYYRGDWSYFQLNAVYHAKVVPGDAGFEWLVWRNSELFGVAQWVTLASRLVGSDSWTFLVRPV